MIDPAHIAALLRRIRPRADWTEADVHKAISGWLMLAFIPIEREVKLSDSDRIDFLCAGGIGIEAKHGKPNTAIVEAQLARYAQSDRITALILVSERGLWNVPQELNGKPVYYVALVKAWGVAL